jgi:hypothetical protein
MGPPSSQKITRYRLIMNDATLTDLHRRIAPVRRLLQEAYRTKAVTKDVYHKGLVQIAYEYAVAGYVDETMGVLMGVEPIYFKTAFVTQMDAEPQFHSQGQTVAEVLATAGLMPMTQKVAHA